MALAEYRYFVTGIGASALTAAAPAGATSLKVTNPVPLNAASYTSVYFWLYDGPNMEQVTVSAVDVNTGTVTLGAGTLFAHGVGAYLATGRFTPVLAELPLVNVQWTASLNEPGDLTGQMLLTGVTGTNIAATSMGTGSNYLYNITPGNTILWVERNGVVQWAGLMVARTYDSESQVLSCVWKDLLFCLSRQRIDTPTTNNYYQPVVGQVGSNLDWFMGYLVRGYIAAGDAYGIGRQTGSVTTSGSPVVFAEPYVVPPYDNRDWLSLLQDLSQQQGATTVGGQSGFDFYITLSKTVFTDITSTVPAYDPRGSYYSATLNIGYPRMGRQTDRNNPYAPTLTMPGSIQHYAMNEDGANIATQIYGFGPGSNEGQYLKRAWDLSGSTQYPSTAAWPQSDDQTNLSQIPSPLTVDQITASQLAARKTPIVTLQVSWMATSSGTYDDAPTIDTFGLGDEFRIIINDPFLSSYDQIMRLVRFTVTVGDNGQPETYHGTFVLQGTY